MSSTRSKPWVVRCKEKPRHSLADLASKPLAKVGSGELSGLGGLVGERLSPFHLQGARDEHGKERRHPVQIHRAAEVILEVEVQRMIESSFVFGRKVNQESSNCRT